MTNPAMLRLLAQLRDEARPLSRASLCLDCGIDDADFDATMAAAREHLAIDDLDRIVAVAGGRDAGSRYKIEPLPRPTEIADGSGWGADFDAAGFPRCVPVVETCYPDCTKHPRRPYTATGAARAADVVLSHADAVDRAQLAAEAHERGERWAIPRTDDDAADRARRGAEGREVDIRPALARAELSVQIHTDLTERGVPVHIDGRVLDLNERIEWLAKKADQVQTKWNANDAHDEGVRETEAAIHRALDRLGVVPGENDDGSVPLVWRGRLRLLADRAKTAQGAAIEQAVDRPRGPCQGAGTYPSAGGSTTLHPIPESLLRAGFNDDYPTEDIDVEAQIAALIELVRMTGAQRQGDGWELSTESMRRLNHGWMQLQDELTSIMRDADPPGYDGVRLKSIHDRVRWLCGRAKAAQGAATYPAIQSDPPDDAAKALDEIDAPKAATIAERIRLFADEAEGRIEFWRKRTRDAADAVDRAQRDAEAAQDAATYPAIQPDPERENIARKLYQVREILRRALPQNERGATTLDDATRLGALVGEKDEEIRQLRAGRDALIDTIGRHQQTIDRLRADADHADDARPLVRLIDSLFDDDELVEIIESEFGALRDIIERGKRDR